jgi:diadenosine tetraphosphate (Ap4A) HIT family hydrolase
LSNTIFKIDPGFADLSIHLGRFKLSHVLLMNNAEIPWFMLIPETQEIELCDLDLNVHHQLVDEIRAISIFIKGHFTIDKLNVACNGNAIRQMHIHVIGRRFDDYCWPGMVWGIEPPSLYEDVETARIKGLLDNDETLAATGYRGV